MKKLFLLLAGVAMTATVSAQTVTESKTTDNIYIGVNTGVATATHGNAWLHNLRPNFGVRIGRNFTPVFGMAVEGNAYFRNIGYGDNPQSAKNVNSGTLVNAVNTGLIGTVNFSNWFSGYPGEPRAFEVSGLFGFGWLHTFNAYGEKNLNALTSKAGLDFAYNFGSDKQFQLYLEPSINWTLAGRLYAEDLQGVTIPVNYGVSYNANRSFVQLNLGFVYKFKNSNGTHNFTIAQLRDQAEIDGLNAQINNLRDELAKKPKEIIKEVVKEVPTKQIDIASDLVFVTFAQGKSVLTDEAKAALDEIPAEKAVTIVGTASPEGSKELNDKLSQNRANAVAEYLKARGVNVESAEGKGVQGTTSNRLAIVYVK